MSKSKIVFDKDALFSQVNDGVVEYRDELFRKFSRNMTSLLESKRPKRYQSSRGLLDSRKLYRHQIDDSIFYKKTSTPNSDTTFLFLIDNSGSMSCRVKVGEEEYLDRLDVCSAIVSAFSKANKTVLGNKIKTEVFAKSVASKPMDGFVKGYVPILSRIYSNAKGDTDWDKILSLDTCPPVKIDGQPSCSYTPEFLLLPALMEWCRKNITTKNMVVINLTDGEVCHTFIDRDAVDAYNSYRETGFPTRRAYDEDTKRLRIKYLRGIPNTTVYIGDGGEYYSNKIKDIYGPSAISAGDSSFSGEFFKLLNRLINEYA